MAAFKLAKYSLIANEYIVFVVAHNGKCPPLSKYLVVMSGNMQNQTLFTVLTVRLLLVVLVTRKDAFLFGILRVLPGLRSSLDFVLIEDCDFLVP
jgi:hypothetical protein